MPSDKAILRASQLVRQTWHNRTPTRSTIIDQIATALDERDAQLAEQARAFSDVARAARDWICERAVGVSGAIRTVGNLAPFIIPEPEPDALTQALSMILTGANNAQTVHDAADKLRAEIARRGGLTIPGDAK